MSFYIGKDYRIYEKKYNEISVVLAQEMEKKRIKVTKAAVFRYLIDKIHNGKLLERIIKNLNNKGGSE